MSAKELIAEVKTIQKLTGDGAVKAVCDVLIDIIKAIDSGDKGVLGFSGEKKK